MAGRVLRVVELQRVTFNDVADGATGNCQLANHIDVSWARTAEMAVRFHEGTIGASSTLSVLAIADGYSMEDPAAIFNKDDLAIAGQVDLSDQETAPYYEVVELGSGSNSPMGGLLSIYVAGTQPTPAVTMDVNISVDLVLRD